MFKNIERKQRLIDDKQKIINDKQKNKKKGKLKDSSYEKNRLLETDFINSVLNNHNPSIINNNDSYHNSRQLEEYQQNSKQNIKQKQSKKNLGEMNLEQLIEKFVNKHSFA